MCLHTHQLADSSLGLRWCGLESASKESYRSTIGTRADSSKRSGQRPPHTVVGLGLLMWLLVVRWRVCTEGV